MEIIGLSDGHVIGNLCELDYRRHAGEAKRAALHVETVRLKYEDGAELHMAYKEYNKQKQRLYCKHGQLLTIRREPYDEDELKNILKDVRAERTKNAHKAVFEARVPNRKSQKCSVKIGNTI